MCSRAFVHCSAAKHCQQNPQLAHGANTRATQRERQADRGKLAWHQTTKPGTERALFKDRNKCLGDRSLAGWDWTVKS